MGRRGPGPGQRFGPTLLAEHLAAEHGLVVPVTTLRRWLRAAGLWTRRGPWPVLLTLVDDATGTTLAQFVPGETTGSAAGVLEA